MFDGSDVGIDGVTVRLYEDTNGNGRWTPATTSIATATTAGGGNYSFTGLDPSCYYLVAGSTGRAARSTPTSPIPSYALRTANPYSVTPAMFTAQSNAVTTADFGYFGRRRPDGRPGLHRHQRQRHL